MVTPEQLQAWLDKLLQLRLSGARSVEYEGRKVEYRSDAELAAAIADAERRLAAVRVRAVTFTTSKGV